MAIESTLSKLYNEAKDGVPEWDKLNESDKGSFICLKLLCEDCPLNYKDENGNCKGRSKIYTYIDSLNIANSLDKDIRRLREDKKSADKDQIADFQLRISSLMKLRNSYTDKCNEIVKSLSFGDLDPEKMKPIEIPVPDPEPIPEVKKKGRVWTEEQIERAKETRRKTWEAKKEKERMLKEAEISENANVSNSEPKVEFEIQGQKLEIVLAIINKRLDLISEKNKELTDKIRSLEEQGVIIDYVLPDLGQDKLISDQECLIHAQELVNQYLKN